MRKRRQQPKELFLFPHQWICLRGSQGVIRSQRHFVRLRRVDFGRSATRRGRGWVEERVTLATHIRPSLRQSPEGEGSPAPDLTSSRGSMPRGGKGVRQTWVTPAGGRQFRAAPSRLLSFLPCTNRPRRTEYSGLRLPSVHRLSPRPAPPPSPLLSEEGGLGWEG